MLKTQFGHSKDDISWFLSQNLKMGQDQWNIGMTTLFFCERLSDLFSPDKCIHLYKWTSWLHLSKGLNQKIEKSVTLVAGLVLAVFQSSACSKLSYVSESDCKNVILTGARGVILATEERISRSFSSRASHFLELWSARWLLSPVL